MVAAIQIGSRLIGPGHPCFIIAEAGVNHNGSVEIALQLVNKANEAGADAVKFQTFVAEEVVTEHAPKAAYQVETTGAEESQLEMARKLELSRESFFRIRRHCDERGIMFLSTPFDLPSVELLEDLHVPAYKVASGEITNGPFLQYVAGKRKPIILSTGMADQSEVETAVQTLRRAGASDIALLHCVSNYPAAPKTVNLRAMATMRERFQVPVGFSDHTVGYDIPVAAVALGAAIVEKHFTLDCNLPGPDHRASLEPQQLAAMVRAIRDVEAALGDGVKRPCREELDTAAVARRSLVAARDIPAGTVLTEDLIAIKRPGTGLPPSRRSDLIGCRVRRDIPAGSLFREELLER